MAVFKLLLMISLALAALGVLLGLWRPVIVLWWLDYQNRRRVLQYYGTALLLLGALWLLLRWLGA
ncbi:hypothetical protein ADICEAN_02609 [Cesiribacter andamanensis AMV16]|uniref:Uncharacterized protein n=2 Tax=Cesiribacter TaxID=1133570 RepID=M7N4X6_9BACT|nr:hypothetical protein ADICEAN_02609 [Cesiribacter andamanensis AMV16]